MTIDADAAQQHPSRCAHCAGESRKGTYCSSDCATKAKHTARNADFRAALIRLGARP